jgi:heat shock protein HslJ
MISIKQKFTLTLISLFLIFISACKTKQDAVNTLEDINNPIEEYADTLNSAEAPLDWSGKYNGIVNSKSNELIEYSLQLNADNTYSLRTFSPNKKDIKPAKTGEFIISESDNIIDLKGTGIKIRIMKDVAQITKESIGTDIDFEKENSYLYKEEKSPLLNNYWVLSSINDSIFDLEKNELQVFLLLNYKERAIYYGGCNRCQISFRSVIEGEIAFLKNGICTKMYCPPESNFDDELNVLLKNTFFYKIENDTLIFSDRKKTLAKFISPL